MRFLLDEMLSPDIADRLRQLGHDAASVLEVGLAATEDAIICDRARAESRVMVTENFADYAQQHDLTLLFVRRRRFSSPAVTSAAIIRWVEEHPAPYPGVHWLTPPA